MPTPNDCPAVVTLLKGKFVLHYADYNFNTALLSTRLFPLFEHTTRPGL
jgi:hypothetical protein